MIIFTRPATASSSPELLHSALIPWNPVWRSCDWIFDIGVTKIYIFVSNLWRDIIIAGEQFDIPVLEAHRQTAQPTEITIVRIVMTMF